MIARQPADYPVLERLLTVAAVKAHYAGIVRGEVERYALPHLGAVHFVLHAALGGGVTRSLALDAHGKTLSAAILDLALPPQATVTPQEPDNAAAVLAPGHTLQGDLP